MPKIELKETAGCTKKFQVEIEQKRIDEQIKTTVKKLKRDIQLPGFRKGKAPDALLLNRFGPTIRQEAIKDVIPIVGTTNPDHIAEAVDALTIMLSDDEVRRLEDPYLPKPVTGHS